MEDQGEAIVEVLNRLVVAVEKLTEAVYENTGDIKKVLLDDRG